MRRSATCLLVGTLILASSSCKSPQRKEKAAAEPVVGSLDSYTPSMRESVYQPDSYPAYGSPTGADDSYAVGTTVGQRSLLPSPSGADMGSATEGQGSSWERRHHTVAKNDTLYGLARMYYGDQRRWKDIYEANRAEISDPNMIRVGQRLLIP